MLKRRARGRRRAAFKSTQIASFARGPTSRRRTRRVRENAAPRRDPARRRTRRRDGDDTFGVETGRKRPTQEAEVRSHDPRDDARRHGRNNTAAH